MQVRSTYRYAKISPFKVREVTRAIQGLPVSAALDLVAFSPKKAAHLIAKTLKSAVANAENNANHRGRGPDDEAAHDASPRKWQPHPEAERPYPDHFDGRDRDQDPRQEKGWKESGSIEEEGACKDDQEREGKGA